MTAIELEKIRSTPKSQSHSFEALSVQLFRGTCDVPEGSTFVSLRGDGGDGGVEAYFCTPEGNILGVQAKYVQKLGASQFRQIKQSFDTALSNHPNLSEYWIYVPFDLTGKRAQGKQGVSERERFEEWRQAKIDEAMERGSTLDIKLCTKTEILAQLISLDDKGGMRLYWFDESVLNQAQTEVNLKAAEAFAGPRYTAALDIITDAHTAIDFFGGIGDFQTWREEHLYPLTTELRSLQQRGDNSLAIVGQSKASEIRSLIDQVICSCEKLREASLESSTCADIINEIDSLMPMLSKIRKRQERKFDVKHGLEHDTPGFRQVSAEHFCNFPAGDMDDARKWEEQVLKLHGVLTGMEIGAATQRSLLLVGPAGIGKTHSIVSAAFRRLERGGHSLVIFGDDFGEGEPWEVIRSKVGFGTNISRDTLLGCLNTCAEHTVLPFVIFIDALNENPRDVRWKDKLPELIEQCKPYTGVKICVSTRDTYRGLVVDGRFPGYSFEHIGFAGREFEAIEAFAAHYGLIDEITPLFLPELCNPLFLHIACKRIKADDRTALDIPHSGFAELLERHLTHCDDLVRKRLKYVNPRNVVKAAMLILADVLNQNNEQDRTWEICTRALETLVGKEISPEALLDELRHEGLIILSTGKEEDEWLVRMGYQRVGDVLRAMNIIESVRVPSGLDMPKLANMLKNLTSEEQGVLESLAAVLPEKTGVELTSRELALEQEHAHRLFVNALTWRSRSSITRSVDRHVYKALSTPGLWEEVFEVFFRLSLVPDHRLNSKNWLALFLSQSSMVNRDAFLSLYAFKSFDAKGAVWSLINAALHADIHRWRSESRLLASLSLAWLTSCSDRRVRDLSSKALTRLISEYPDLAVELVRDFSDCDDDYILESISLAVYSACLLTTNKRDKFIPILEELLISPTFNTPNVLIRDSVRLLGCVLKELKLSKELKKNLAEYPSKEELPNTWPTQIDAQPLLDLERLPMNMNLMEHVMIPDFWKYQVDSKIRNFDLQQAGISLKNLACWIMVETLRLGYPGREDCTLHTDNTIDYEFGSGRGRKTYAERLGKKYYWLLLHRLIGILADNLSIKKLYEDWNPGPNHFWSLDVRKSDLTDVRDISTEINYPDEILYGPSYDFPDRNEADVETWVRTNDFTPGERCLVRTSEAGEEWVALSLYAAEDDCSAGRDILREPYQRLSVSLDSILIQHDIEDEDIKRFKNNEWYDNRKSFYNGYIAEYPDSLVFDQLFEEKGYSSLPTRAEVSETVLLRGGDWEYEFSFWTPDHPEDLCVPNKDLVNILDLKWDKQRGWIDSNGKLIAFDALFKNRRGLFMIRSAVDRYLKLSNRQLVHLWFAKRLYFTGDAFESPQIDLSMIVRYQRLGNPVVLKRNSELFKCREDSEIQSTETNFPF